jgi:hypothetical protein
MRTLIPLRFGLFVIVLLWVLTPADVFGSGSASAQNLAADTTKVYDIVIGSKAPEQEIFAAEELVGYLQRLYGLKVEVTRSPNPEAAYYLLIGSPTSNPAVADAVSGGGWPKISDQGVVLKTASLQNKRALIIGGGSPAATLWAVYDLVKRAGVTYLIEKDVFPEKPATFPPPELNVVNEPVFPLRVYGGINDLPTSRIFYGVDDYRHLIDQLAKMKFNGFFASAIYPFQPFVQYEFRGQKKVTGVLDYGWKLPIHEESIGKQLFGGKTEFVNPDLADAKTYDERVHDASAMLRDVLSYAKSRGMKTGLLFLINKFPEEFNAKLPEWSSHEYIPKETMKGLYEARLGISDEGIDPLAFQYLTPDNPVVMELNRTVIEAYVNSYPEVDYYGLLQPELPVTGQQYKSIWARLNQTYKLEPQFDLEEMEKSAKQNTGPVGVRQGTRPLGELKTAISYADTLDKLVNDDKILQKTANPHATIIASTFSDEFYPVLDKIFPQGVEQLITMDYLPSLAAERTGMLAFASKSSMKINIIATMSDDNVGVLPQFTAPSLHTIFQAAGRYKVNGIVARNFLSTKLEATTAYLAAASWNPVVTPQDVYRDQVSQVCGEAAVPDMLKAYQILGDATLKGNITAFGFLFPVPDVMSKHWESTSGPNKDWDELTAYYQQAVPLVESALRKSRPEGRTYINAILGQLKFSIHYIQSVQKVRQARLDYNKVQEELHNKNIVGYASGMAVTNQELAEALALLRSAIEEWAAVVQDPGDLGTLAALDSFAYDYLKGLTHKVYLESQFVVFQY